MEDRVLKNPLKMNLVFIKKAMLFFLPWLCRNARVLLDFKPISKFIGWKLRLLIHLAKTDTFSQLFNTTAKMVRCLNKILRQKLLPEGKKLFR